MCANGEVTFDECARKASICWWAALRGRHRRRGRRNRLARFAPGTAGVPAAGQARVGAAAGLFGPAWTVLYATIGVAGWRLWTRGGGRTVLVLHVTQLALNGAWPFTFFAGQPHRRTAVIAILDLAIAAEIVAAAPTSA